MSKIRTRFAPSPTGYMHIGNLRTALYCYLIAKHQGGDFILRIEDTDQNREVKGATDVIFNTLKETGLNWDEGPDKPGDVGPYIQSERLGIYKDYANKLIQVGAAHYCFCNKDEKETEGFEMRDPCRYLSSQEVQAKLDAGEEYVIRQTIPEEGVASFDDEIYGHIEAPVDTLDDAVLLKSDGFPTYNFANVVDDHLMGITDVVRGNEYLSSTPKYNLLYKAFNWNPPRYIHLPPVMKDEHNKLSKRNGDASFQDLKAEGYLPQAILNYIALLGWAPADEEILSLDDLIKQFTVDRISKAPAIFDKDKLTWVNETYLRNMTLDEFHDLVSPLYKDALTREVDEKEISMVLQPRLTRINLDEVKGFVDFINECLPFDAALYKHKKMKTNPYNSLEALKLSLPAMEAWEDYSDDDGMMHMQMDIAKEHELKNGRIMWPIRVALSNKAMTPGGSVEIAHILGKEETLKRMRQAINDLEAWVKENPEA
ncbi:glutamate--tRNA ligase [Sharpea azabuensis]|uniref:Glutamate--tRNA ligase n=1 Tax=Sharpea azabuensis TaxID=322505 RepID=A0A1H6X882_9FIRM|nr:glutamate--tRNA ligase [Sharpea azabuensis]HAJ15428.1 glutamate--tRNA ligase [Erysipelotrichaceae bacterium]SEJ21052.1 glutamyl-tRNA synthetase [Sharpea azabuensis]HAV18672.1 glutamate--tRNA ligase [Erysipelotrichaceae bacterium]HBG85867.1 glutamate--tRNA ligase [Erysipelotrichaceae bacterium]HCG96773.1 glutamate--tRNA ligase [Erysipelotrichaceae bacterium]